MISKLTGTVLGVGVLLASPSWAHHSFAAEYDSNQPVVLTGTLTKMEWVNPHGWLYVDVKEPDGKVVNWAIEAGNPNALLRRGLRTTDFPAGIKVTVTGYRSKNGTPTVNGRTVKLMDGRDFFFGSSGTGAPKDSADREER
jgi:Family of unknown function (DUF6152)